METRDFYGLHSKTLECGNQQDSKDKIDEASCSLNHASKLQILSEVEDLVTKRVILERHNVSASQLFCLDTTEGHYAFTVVLSIKKERAMEKVRLICKFGTG